MRYVLSLGTASVLFILSYIYIYIYDFNYILSYEYRYAAIFDWLLNVLLILFIFHFHRKSMFGLADKLSFEYKFIIEKYWLIFLFVFFIICFYSLERFNLIINGITREELVFDSDRGRFMMLVSPMVIVLTAVAFVFNYSLKVKVLLLLSLVITSLYMLSRSDLLSVLYLSILLMCLKEVKLKVVVKLFFYSILLLVFVGVMTIYQGRVDGFFSSLGVVVEALIKYRTFALYLSEYSAQKMSGDVESFLFPFFGFFIERFLSIFSSISNPVVVQGSEFVYEFIWLGDHISLSANVVYPWWSWFYGHFGYFGLILKLIYIYVIFYFFKSKFVFTTIFLLNVVLFQSFTKHPFLNNDSVYQFFAYVFLDCVLIFYIRFRNSENYYVNKNCF